ncbi:MAG: acyl-CoA thioesterase [Planctomycetota bacterium]|nr:acyl-CoA thioesterase [Planctomycetota bacterium]
MHSENPMNSEFKVEKLIVPASLEIAVQYPFTLSLIVTQANLSSTIAHVSNVEYLRWIDRISDLHGTSCGQSRQQLLAQERMWFVSRHEIDYLAEAFAQDRLGCATWFSKFGRTTVQRETLIWNRDQGIAICRASSRWVFMDLKTRKPTRFDDMQVKSFQLLAIPPSEV